jgi:selenocysteine-specific elongation factor
MIVGTAGHIDHGKTTLVRALTGVDTDRLKEEKARGITIELGYAYTPVAGDEVLGFVDVPGHERFVHTMVAGATGIDHALLVVAADDGVMPQTREHLDILQLLGVREGTVALSKVDRATPERVAQVRAELAFVLLGSTLAGAPVFETAASRDDDAGVAALKRHLEDTARRQPRHDVDGLFRLAVDRVFSLPGHGTIVTGSVHGGVVNVGDTLLHSASGQHVRVRSIHAQNRPSERGHSHQRCALNLAGIDTTAIVRGDWIADERALRASRRIDARFQLLPGAPELATWASVHVHLGTAHRVAHVAPLEGDRLQPGTPALAQLVFEQPVFALAGDRFIVRNAQASRTIGGGAVIDPLGPERRRRSAERLAWLAALEAARDGGAWTDVVAHAPAGLLRSQLAWLMDAPEDRLPAFGDGVHVLPDGPQDALLVADAAWQLAGDEVVAALARFHEAHPDEPGVNAARLRRMTMPGHAPTTGRDTWWRALLDALLRDGRLQATGAWLHLAGHAVTLSAPEQALAERLLPWIEAGGIDPPWVRELAARAAAPEDEVRTLLRKLARQGRLFQSVKDLFVAPSRVQELARLVAALDARGGHAGVRAADLRDAAGLGRKRAIQLLEFFDRAGYTRRVRDAHVLIGESGWLHVDQQGE